MPLASCLPDSGSSVTPFIVLACVVLHNMLRRERGAGGARDLEDEVISCDVADGG